MSYILKIIAAVSILFVAATCLIDSDWEVSHEMTIDADTSIIWSLLVNLDGYSEWNKYSPNVEGRAVVGETVWVEAHLDNEVQRVKNIVLSVKPEQELCWQSGGWYAFLAQGTRCRWLSKTSNGDTKLVHHEIMSGPLAWFIEWKYRERIERGIRMVDESLANRAEELAEKQR